ncbi:hypothetical protein SAMN04487846_3576 [Microbacterium sp. cf046]|uniref:hypothetical protein n=1 Tax=Microbacterium sp. cf046 TaxID=1761803 RepID=UPI0008E720C3|nr:hypothetical protein [Microbacterium sp. cf046]SFS17499.1 hypothetical protein SAMN04487846_3576 [Microbacterium sp. cf046]
MPDYWLTVGAVAVIAALTSAIVTVWGVSRPIKHKAVIEERQNWRQAIRELIPKFVNEEDEAARNEIRNAIVLRLNPYKDQSALDLLGEYATTPSAELAGPLVAHFQAMLKLEWQRAKREAGLFPWGAGWRAALSVRWQKWRSAKRDARATVAP